MVREFFHYFFFLLGESGRFKIKNTAIRSLITATISSRCNLVSRTNHLTIIKKRWKNRGGDTRTVSSNLFHVCHRLYLEMQSYVSSFQSFFLSFFFFYRRQLARYTSANKLCKGNETSVENTGTITPVRPRVDS